MFTVIYGKPSLVPAIKGFCEVNCHKEDLELKAWWLSNQMIEK